MLRGTNGVVVHALESGKEALEAQEGQRACSSRKESSPNADKGSYQMSFRDSILGGVKEDRPGATTFVLTVSLDAEARPKHQQSAAGPHGVRGHHAHRCKNPPGEKSQATAGDSGPSMQRGGSETFSPKYFYKARWVWSVFQRACYTVISQKKHAPGSCTVPIPPSNIVIEVQIQGDHGAQENG